LWFEASLWQIVKKNPSQKRAGRVGQGVGHEFKPQYGKKKKKRRRRLAESTQCLSDKART
jgi:hypothetical protein